MINREFKILFVGRVVGDLVLDQDRHSIMPVTNGIELKINGKQHHIRTDSTLTKDNDKVTSLDDLDHILPDLKYEFYMGGGGANSLFAGADMRVKSPELGITFLTPSKTYLSMNGQVIDLADYLKIINVQSHFMNFTPMNYNLVIGGDNKSIIRNKQRGDEEFTLEPEHKRTLVNYIGPSDGILINALNDRDMTAHIVETVHDENQAVYHTSALLKERTMEELVHHGTYMQRPKHRKIMTVVAHSKKMPKDTIVEKIVPYSGLIFNETDTIKIFCGEEKDLQTRGNPNQRLDLVLKVMSQLRYGVPTKHGVRRKIEDEFNNIYVTLGRQGHLVATKDTVYHMKINDNIVSAINEDIKRNRSSAKGAGDAFATGIIHHETKGLSSDRALTAAFANTAVCKYLGINRVIHESEVEQVAQYNLSDHYLEKSLD